MQAVPRGSSAVHWNRPGALPAIPQSFQTDPFPNLQVSFASENSRRFSNHLQVHRTSVHEKPTTFEDICGFEAVFSRPRDPPEMLPGWAEPRLVSGPVVLRRERGGYRMRRRNEGTRKP